MKEITVLLNKFVTIYDNEITVSNSKRPVNVWKEAIIENATIIINKHNHITIKGDEKVYEHDNYNFNIKENDIDDSEFFITKGGWFSKLKRKHNHGWLLMKKRKTFNKTFIGNYKLEINNIW